MHSHAWPPSSASEKKTRRWLSGLTVGDDRALDGATQIGCLPGLSGVRMALGCGAALDAALGSPCGSMDASGGCVAVLVAISSVSRGAGERNNFGPR